MSDSAPLSALDGQTALRPSAPGASRRSAHLPPGSVHRPLAWALLLAAFFAPPAAADDRPLPTIDEVRSHVDETLSSIVTARVKYRRSQSIDPDSPIDLTGVDSLDWQDYVFTWWMERDKRAMEREAKQYADSERWSREHKTFDGKHHYEAYYRRDDPSRMEKLHISPDLGPGRFEMFSPESWLGLDLVWTDQTLLSLLNRLDARVVGWEPIGGHACVHVDLGRGRSRSGDELSWEVWLDPARDWLPRRMVTRSSTDEGVRSYLHEVTRFRSIPDRLLGRDRWFPDQFFGRHLAREDYKVLQMTVNEPSPPNLFTIEPQPGTEVAEIDPNNPRATRIWIQGGSAALADIRTEVIEEAREMAANGGPAADASPPTSSNLTLYGWLLAALLGIAALLIWWRQ